MTINGFVIAATIVFIWLAIIWSKGTWLNMVYKFVFAILAVVGGYFVFINKMLTFLH